MGGSHAEANAGITFNFPAIGGGGGRGAAADGRRRRARGRTYEDLKRERDRRLDELARLFDEARAYAKAGPDKTVDWALEALVPVVERKLPLVTTVQPRPTSATPWPSPTARRSTS